jgi:hypothetical protein
MAQMQVADENSMGAANVSVVLVLQGAALVRSVSVVVVCGADFRSG